MKKRISFRMTVALLLALCLVGTNLVGVVPAAAAEQDQAAVEPEAKYPLYFLNSEGWAGVGAYIYGDQGELLGTWGTTTAVADEGQWVKVMVTAKPPYSVIFYNTANNEERVELYIDAADKIYVNTQGEAFTSKQAAQDALNGTDGPDAPVGQHTLYFLNSNNWANVGVHAYADADTPLTGSWGTTVATADGDNWVKATINGAAPYAVIIFNKDKDSERVTLNISSADKVYVNAKGHAFESKAAAEQDQAAVEPEAKYPLYFLNSEGWAGVGAYIYGDKGNLLGAWGTTTAVADEGQWVKVMVAAEPPYSVIFYNTENPDGQRAELYIDAADKIYVNAKSHAFTSKEAAQNDQNAPVLDAKYPLYFLNSEGWASVGAYIYGDQGELLGTWGTTTAVADEGRWVKVMVTAEAPYSVIFYNTEDPDGQRAELFVDAADKIYITAKGRAFPSKQLAEKSLDPTGQYYVYFLNSKGWTEVGAYIYGDQGELLGSWGTTTAEAATELGDKWLKVLVPELPPYNIIFYSKADETQRSELLIDAADKLYVTAGALAYTSKDEAEKYAGVTAEIDPNNRDYGPDAEVVDKMEGTEVTPQQPQSNHKQTILIVVAVVAAAAVLTPAVLLLIKRKKSSK